ncbi:MAG: oxidoreductase [Planctomycetes bacterium]|nr:oxidoreductase [Planctomycetota bacterium]
MPEQRPTIYEAAGGRQAFFDLAHAWHRRCLADEVVAHAFSHGFHPQHSERLALYWIEAFGGPADYSQTIGDESFVLRMHAGNGQHPDMDQRAEACFALALEDTGLSRNDSLRQSLQDYFHWATVAMAAYPRSADDVPAGLRVARWSWDGPVPNTSSR